MKDRISGLLKFLFIIMVITGCTTGGEKEKTKTCEDNFPSVEKWLKVVDEESLSNYGPFPKSGYVNEKGDTMIPLDEYYCISDTFEYFALVQEIKTADRKIFGIDKQGNKLFEAVPGMEPGDVLEEYERRIVIQKDAKYGFANHKGDIVIEPVYTCIQGRGFFNGKASVSNKCREEKDEHKRWESDEWISIDKCGNIVTANQ